MRARPFLVSAGVLLAAACARQPAFKPVASVKQLMEATVHPTSSVIFDAVGTIITTSGVQEIAPKNDEEWEHVRDNALTLAEAGNLLMMEGRARKDDQWMGLARGLVDAGVVAFKAAEAKNAEALFEAGGDLYGVCLRCHSRYWDPKAFEKMHGAPPEAH